MTGLENQLFLNYLYAVTEGCLAFGVISYYNYSQLI
jgi:hypothetical protein